MPKKKSTKPALPMLLLLGGGLALVLAGLLLASQNKPEPVIVQEAIPYPEIARVSIEEANAALASNSTVILDVRSAEAFAGQRITGAINIPTAEIETRLGELDPNAWIIPYCT